MTSYLRKHCQNGWESFRHLSHCSIIWPRRKVSLISLKFVLKCFFCFAFFCSKTFFNLNAFSVGMKTTPIHQQRNETGGGRKVLKMNCWQDTHYLDPRKVTMKAEDYGNQWYRRVDAEVRVGVVKGEMDVIAEAGGRTIIKRVLVIIRLRKN